MWNLYDALIEGIPSHIKATDIRVTPNWGYVKTADSCGIGVLYPLETRLPLYQKDWTNCPLKDIAACAKSWNYIEASIGIAAMNCYYNSIEVAINNNIELGKTAHSEDRMHDPFIHYQRDIREKNVTVIGHFPYLETLFEPVCNLSIIETEPQTGDYPLPAMEYLLPLQDYVFVTCGSLTLKTLPRILELSKNAYVTIVGPATPMAPVLFDFGVHDLSGFVFTDLYKADRILTGSQFGTLYSTGHKVHLKKEIYDATLHSS